ncbi:hypothetical protein ACCQ23_15755 [Xanthomonas axonopodis pv. phyllanthi]
MKEAENRSSQTLKAMHRRLHGQLLATSDMYCKMPLVAPRVEAGISAAC